MIGVLGIVVPQGEACMLAVLSAAGFIEPRRRLAGPDSTAGTGADAADNGGAKCR